MKQLKRVFSGVQPTGNLHIGNYLGAIKNWANIQNDFENFFCIVDLHAITVSQDPKELKKNILNIANVYLAAGIDPKKSTIFVQSDVPAHSELAWILNTITSVGELSRMTQYKDKGKNKPDNSSVGLFDYPVLMASDILLYDTAVIPVGEDQKQHIELTRNLAQRFNNKFGKTFIVPEILLKKEGMRIMALDDPTSKMSKSAVSDYSRINLTDQPELIRKKIAKAVTDSGKEIKASSSKPAITNLLNIYSLFSNKSVKSIEDQYKNKNYGEFKKDLGEVIATSLLPFQEKLKELEKNPIFTRNMLEKGAQKANKIALQKLAEIKEKIGLG